MDDEFGLLVACDTPRCVNGLLLRVVHGGRPLIAGSLDGPPVLPAMMALLQWNYRRPSRSTGLSTAARCSTIRCSRRQQEGQANPTWSRRKTCIRCLAGQQCIRARVPVQLACGVHI
jgi:hypothetical protein